MRDPETEPDKESSQIERLPTQVDGLGSRITGWTNNLLATAVIVVIALTFGSYLVSNYQADEAPVISASIESLWPEMEACTLQFGDMPLQILRGEFSGDYAALMQYMEDQCRRELVTRPDPTRELGDAETEMLNRLGTEKPADQDDGKWRIFHVANVPGSNQLPQVVGIRDDCNNQSKLHSRMVVWALAVPQTEESWTTYLGRSVTNDPEQKFVRSLIPVDAKRTMAISSGNNSAIIGFQGSEPDKIRRFYDELAQSKNWKLETPWKQSGDNSWTARFRAKLETGLRGIQVQFQSNHNRTRGIIRLSEL